ncbi:MAG: hypothetical protein AB1774_09285 [Bacillota bacterium]
MQTQDLETRLVEACIALGYICAEEAKWADGPDVKALMVRHAIRFLDAARSFLPRPHQSVKMEAEENYGRNRSSVEEVNLADHA